MKDQDFVLGTCLDKLNYTLFPPFVFPWLLQDHVSWVFSVARVKYFTLKGSCISGKG